MATGDVEAMYFFAKYPFNLPYIFIQKMSYIFFVKSGLTPCTCLFKKTKVGPKFGLDRFHNNINKISKMFFS